MKVLAIANDPDNMEKLINDYLYSKSYTIVLEKKDKIEYKIRNSKATKEFEDMINENFKIKYKKGKYYFYKDEESTK